MKIVQDRVEFGAHHTMSSLTIDDEWAAWVLEDVVREVKGQPVSQWKIKGLTAIPRGLYEVKITPSARFKRDLPELLNVPGFVGIRVHPGNTAADTEGCLLPGLDRFAQSVGRSKLAFDSIFFKIKEAIAKGERVTWDIV